MVHIKKNKQTNFLDICARDPVTKLTIFLELALGNHKFLDHICLLAIFVNKVVLRHSLTHLLTFYLTFFFFFSFGNNLVVATWTIGPTKPNTFSYLPFTEKFADLCCRVKQRGKESYMSLHSYTGESIIDFCDCKVNYIKLHSICLDNHGSKPLGFVMDREA